MKKFIFLFIVIFATKLTAQTITIPVVFHVVYKTAAQNIPDSCLQQQLDRLNLDYRKLNPDTAYIPAAWQALAADMGINFAFATVDPNGNATTGIERVQTVTTSFSTNDNVKHTSMGGCDAWPDTTYLNIWVCNLSAGLLGYAQYPGGNPATDGVVLHYGVTGVSCANPYAPFNLGRTGTFEVARWLGMRAMIGGGTACTDNDTIADTPSMENDAVGTIAPFTVITDACQGSAPGVMWMNYMTYVDDGSKYFFTQGQKAVAWWVINNMRMGLLDSSTTTGIASATMPAFQVYPSPSDGKVLLDFSGQSSTGQHIVIRNLAGQVIRETDHGSENIMAIDLTGEPAGIYFITVESEAGSSTQKIVIASE